MRKLRLELEDLTVESFETMEVRGARRGTVQGAARLLPVDTALCDTAAGCAPSPVCGDTDGCPDTGWQQCGYSYGGTCGASPPVTYDADCGGGLLANVYPVDDSPYLCA